MRVRLFCAAAVLLASPALAEEAGTALRAKALAAAAGASKEAPVHEAANRPDPYAELFKAPPVAADALRDSCDNAAGAVCYDANDRRLVYRDARKMMPGLPGLSPESVSVKRDRVTLRYSFR